MGKRAKGQRPNVHGSMSQAAKGYLLNMGYLLNIIMCPQLMWVFICRQADIEKCNNMIAEVTELIQTCNNYCSLVLRYFTQADVICRAVQQSGEANLKDNIALE